MVSLWTVPRIVRRQRRPREDGRIYVRVFFVRPQPPPTIILLCTTHIRYDLWCTHRAHTPHATDSGALGPNVILRARQKYHVISHYIIMVLHAQHRPRPTVVFKSKSFETNLHTLFYLLSANKCCVLLQVVRIMIYAHSNSL